MSDNPYYKYLESLGSCYEEASNVDLTNLPEPKKYFIDESAPKVVLLAPHPDDECVMGGLPLRLYREAGCRIVTLPVTMGSNPNRKQERMEELRQACQYLGFELEEICPEGLNEIHPAGKKNNPKNWEKSIELLSHSLNQLEPDLIFFPNSNDWNQTHLGVNLLTLESLSHISADTFTLIETEFWGQMPRPNLLVESSRSDVTDLISALSFHRGEVERNPFHLRLPFWMQDNVRRGAEVIGGQGEVAPNFNFATPYRVTRVQNGNFQEPWQGGRMLPSKKDGDRSLIGQLISS